MTNLNIIPNFEKKTAKFTGTIAAGENIHVTISDIGGYIGGVENLRLRAVGSDGGTLATFPPLGDESLNWVKDGDTIECDLNLNTVQMLEAVPPASRVMVLFVLDNPKDEILYFKSFFAVDHWPRRVGEDEPVDLGGYADFVAEVKNSIEEAEAVIESASEKAMNASKNALEAAKNAEEAVEVAKKIEEEFDTKADATALEAEVSRAKGAEAALAGRVTELEENGGGSSVEVVAPSPDGEGKAADAKAVYEELEKKRDLDNLDYVREEPYFEPGYVLQIYNLDKTQLLKTVNLKLIEERHHGAFVTKVWEYRTDNVQYQLTGELAGYESYDWRFIASDEYGIFFAPTWHTSLLNGLETNHTVTGTNCVYELQYSESIEFTKTVDDKIALVSQIPAAPDLTPYAKTADVPTAIAGKEIKPSSVVMYDGAYRTISYSGASPLSIHEEGYASKDCHFVFGSSDVAWIIDCDEKDHIKTYSSYKGKGISLFVINRDRGESREFSLQNDLGTVFYSGPEGEVENTIANMVNAMPRYRFVDAAIADGVVTIAPYTNAKIASDGTAFAVAVGEGSGYMRDCVLRVECGETAPKITWGANFHPRTDAETDFACVAGVRNVYWITEHAPDEFTVAGWQETVGGNAE